MRAVRAGFLLGLTIQMIVSRATDRDTYRPGPLRKSWKRFKASPLMSRDLWDQLREYDQPNFHPDDRDTTDLVER